MAPPENRYAGQQIVGWIDLDHNSQRLIGQVLPRDAKNPLLFIPRLRTGGNLPPKQDLKDVIHMDLPFSHPLAAMSGGENAFVPLSGQDFADQRTGVTNIYYRHFLRKCQIKILSI